MSLLRPLQKIQHSSVHVHTRILPAIKQPWMLAMLRHSSSSTANPSIDQQPIHDDTVSPKLRHIDELPTPGLFLSLRMQLKNGIGRRFETEAVFAKKYGPIFLENIFGNKYVIISDPDMAEKVYRAETKWPLRKFTALSALFEQRQKTNLPPSLVDLQGEDWGKLRKIIGKQLLKPVKLKQYYDTFDHVACDAVNLIEANRDSTGLIEDVEPLLSKWAIESMGVFSYGQRSGLLEDTANEKALEFLKAVDYFMTNLTEFSLMKWRKHFKRSQYREFERSLGVIHSVGFDMISNIVKQIHEADANGTEVAETIRKSFVFYLLSEDGMDEKECIVHAVDALSAGKDTTSVVLSWLLYHLGTNAEQQEKLAAEVVSISDKRDSVVDAPLFQQMPYLRAFIKESARLQPVAPSIERVLETDLEVGGYLLPKDTIVLLSNWVMSNDEKVYPNAEKFEPERWLRGSKHDVDVNPFSTLPFGYGARSCVGRRVAEAEIQVFLYNALKRFKIKYVGKKQSGMLNLVRRPMEQLSFQFIDR